MLASRHAPIFMLKIPSPLPRILTTPAMSTFRVNLKLARPCGRCRLCKLFDHSPDLVYRILG
jgi:hypothetical protein